MIQNYKQNSDKLWVVLCILQLFHDLILRGALLRYLVVKEIQHQQCSSLHNKLLVISPVALTMH